MGRLLEFGHFGVSGNQFGRFGMLFDGHGQALAGSRLVIDPFEEVFAVAL